MVVRQDFSVHIEGKVSFCLTVCAGDEDSAVENAVQSIMQDMEGGELVVTDCAVWGDMGSMADALPMDYVGGGECNPNGKGTGKQGRPPNFAYKPRPKAQALGSKLNKMREHAELMEEVTQAKEHLPKVYPCKGLRASISLKACEQNRKRGECKPCIHCEEYKEWK